LLFLTCLLGIVGNGTVVWILSFRMKRTPFTTYILNLAIADIGVLILQYIYLFLLKNITLLVMCSHYCITLYNTDQLLLTAISVDRCVAVLYPVWHRCHRRPHLSRTVCVFIWVLSFLLTRAHPIKIPILVAFVCTILNCSVNPLIYFLVGRDKKSRSGLSMKVALQRVFKDEENSRGEEGLQAENQV
ncbi:LOW QUALITY PROTEIN: proto-oncogene Mas-like, partial [Sphaerodactylus townsendi]|uniref:LOW QUALITY PROTEIN: proto-oncogene Mas-like n=1 Tax=Sphaerodactylus townsendi TaxID=933632 RepID=UPI00202612E9